jgi:hypothetical protein
VKPFDERPPARAQRLRLRGRRILANRGLLVGDEIVLIEPDAA